MRPFLKVIAEGYARRYPQLYNLTFVLPNKRSGMFLLREFSETSAKPMLAPRILTISEFVAGISGKVSDSRLDLIFRLFKCYREVPFADKDLSFELFTSWGETLLNDFNEIDMQMINPDEIFKNVYDLNSIRTNFLTPQQKKVMVDYFGYSPDILKSDNNDFWHRFEELTTVKEYHKKVRKKFSTLWGQLNLLYHSFKEDLEVSGLNTEGGCYREAAEKVNDGYEPFEGEKIVFVGFNALSESERQIFKALKEMTINLRGEEEPKADFIWDRVSDKFEIEGTPISQFVSIYSQKENFPSPSWLSSDLNSCSNGELPQITVIEVPSNVMQAKIIGEELGKLPDEIVKNKDRLARIAVVLPDENLLLPMLYALPEKLGTPNLTMGFLLKQTPVVSFISLIRRLQKASVRKGNSMQFYLEAVNHLLAHPYCGILFEKEAINDFRKNIEKKRQMTVSQKELASLGKAAGKLFIIIDDDSNPRNVILYLKSLLRLVVDQLQEKQEKSFLDSKVEKIFIGAYIDALTRLENCIEKYDFSIKADTVFTLSYRLLSSEKVAFEGEPLEGVQIMGVLETRCLDFDKVFMPSLNEKIMPRIGRNSSFIPNVIRCAFGMPPANYQEEIFAYYFYRALGRCSEAFLTFDSRSSENRTPGPSRYLLQLKYLVEGLNFIEYEGAFTLQDPVKGKISVGIDENVKKKLASYLVDSNEDMHFFSPSALKKYFKCKLMFLLECVMDLHPEEPKQETIDSSELGTIVHKAMEKIYFPENFRGKMLNRPLLITPEFLHSLLDEVASESDSRILVETRRAIMEVHYPKSEEKSKNLLPRGSVKIIEEYIVKYVCAIIREDIQQAPFRLWGSEINRTLPYRLSSGKTVRLKMVIDRLDQVGEEGIYQPFRIVDYKTGSVNLSADTFDDILGKSYKADNIFQLLFYAEMLIMSVQQQEIKLPEGLSVEEFASNLEMVIYDIPNMLSKNLKQKTVKTLCIGRVPGPIKGERAREVKNMGEFRQIENEQEISLMKRLDGILEEIINPDIPFDSSEDEKACTFCLFKLRCDMAMAKQKYRQNILDTCE